MLDRRTSVRLFVVGGLLLLARFLIGDGIVGAVVGWAGFALMTLTLLASAAAQPKADSSAGQSNSSPRPSNSPPTSAVPPSGVTAGRTCLELGDRVLVYSRDQWWRARVAGIDDGDLVRVTFTGYDPANHYCVPRRFLQLDVTDTGLAGCNPTDPSGLKVGPDTHLHEGRRVLAYSNGRWYRAEIAGIDRGGMVRIVWTNFNPASQYCVHRQFLQLDVSDLAPNEKTGDGD